MLLARAGLEIDNTVPEARTAIELFRRLLGGAVDSQQVRNRVRDFLAYLRAGEHSRLPFWLSQLAQLAETRFVEQVIDPNAFYNAPFMLLASNLFRVRLLLYTEHSDRLTVQYFGSKAGIKARVLISGSRYLFMGKTRRRDMQRCSSIRARVIYSGQLGGEPTLPTPKARDPSAKRVAPVSQRRVEKPDTNGPGHEELYEAFMTEHKTSTSELSAESIAHKNKGRTPTGAHGQRIDVSEPLQVIVRSSPTSPFIPRHLALTDSPQAPVTSSHDSCIPDTFRDKVIFESQTFTTGRLKFYSEHKGFGFIVSPEGVDIFVHKDDLLKTGIDTCRLECLGSFYDIIVRYKYIEYKGRAGNSNKAINVNIVEVRPIG